MLTSIETTSPTTVKVNARCDLDGSETSMVFTMSESEFMGRYNRWQGGAMVQDAFDNLAADEREFLMTGITPDKWNAMFGEG